MPKLTLDDYIKVDRDVTGGEVIKFLDEGTLKESSFKNKDGSVKMQLNFSVELNGEKKLMTVNKTSQKLLAGKWTTDTALWVGKTAKISTGMTPQGKKCIYLEPVE